MACRHQERAAAQPAHHAAGAARLRRQGTDPRDPVPATPASDGLREDVRARQGRAAQPRRARSRWARSTRTSTTSRATGSSPDKFALPDISLTADEAAVVGLATKVWQHAGLAEATTEAVRKLTAAGRRRRRVGARHRRAAAQRRRAVVRRVLRGHPGAHPGHLRLPPAATRPSRRPGTSSRGGSPATPAAGTSSATTPTARPSGCSGSPGSQGEAPQGRRARVLRRARWAPTSARSPAGSRPRSRPTASCCWCARAPGTRCAATPTVQEGVDRPGRRRAPGTGWCSPDAPQGLADEILGLRRRRRGRGTGRAAQSGRRPARQQSVTGGVATQPRQRGAKDQVARLLTLVPYLQAHGEVRLEEARPSCSA